MEKIHSSSCFFLEKMNITENGNNFFVFKLKVGIYFAYIFVKFKNKWLGISIILIQFNIYDWISMTDFNECNIYGTCDQICKNTHGSYQCSCISGYSRFNDSKCRGINEPKDEHATLLFMTQHDIRQVSHDDSSKPPTVLIEVSF